MELELDLELEEGAADELVVEGLAALDELGAALVVTGLDPWALEPWALDATMLALALALLAATAGVVAEEGEPP